MEEIVKVEPMFLAPVVSVDDALRAYQAKKDLIDHIMRPGVDYGAVPGTDKPTLKKAGAEKATSFFGLRPIFADAEVVEDWTGTNHGGEMFFYYRRTCNLYRGDTLIASVDGSCNSWEKKYRYRNGERTCPVCGKAAIKKSKYPPKGQPNVAPGWYCYAKLGGCGAEFSATDEEITGQEIGQTKNPDVADSVNTILKMADKRALVAATLIATGLSEYFTQDMEDFIDDSATAQERSKTRLVVSYDAAAAIVTPKGKRFDELTLDQLNYMVEHGNQEQKEAAQVVMAHDFNVGNPSAPATEPSEA